MSLYTENPFNPNLMEELENKEPRKEEVFSRVIRAGKRTYFFDVKATRSGENYVTITESKRRFNNDQGKFFYEKHKVFLYKEDFDKFMMGLNDVIRFIETGEKPPEIVITNNHDEEGHFDEEHKEISHTDVEFEDLGPTESEDK